MNNIEKITSGSDLSYLVIKMIPISRHLSTCDYSRSHLNSIIIENLVQDQQWLLSITLSQPTLDV